MSPDEQTAPPSLTIVAPMFNEEANVASTVKQIRDAMADFPGEWEFIMVNDGSTDGTLAAARAEAERDPRVRVLSYPRNRGRGYALRTGFAAARGDIVVSIDFDLSYSPDHILKLYRFLCEHEGVDAVLGSAYMPGGKTEGVPFNRLFWSKLGNRILSWAFGGQFKTITCVLRGYRRGVLDALELESDGKEIHLEILSKLAALGYVVEETPATLRWRKKGASKFKLRRTSASHLLFSALERPMMMFGLLGAGMLALGAVVGVFLLREFYIGLVDPARPFHPDRPLMTVLVVLLLGGVQFLAFGFLAIQIASLRRELYVIQRALRRARRGNREDDAP